MFSKTLEYLSLPYENYLGFFPDLASAIEDCQSVVEEHDTGPTKWQKRMENHAVNWETIRETIFTSLHVVL